MASDDSDSDNHEEEEEEELEDDLEDEEEEEIRPSKSAQKRKRRRGSQFIEDAAEEADDDDEDDDDDPQERRRRKHKAALTYIEDAADVAGSDEEEEEMGEDDDFIEHGGEELGGPEEEVRTARMHHKMLEDEEENDEEMEKYIKDRYGRQAREDVEEGEDQQALLPSVKDPKLWLVKCQLGHEREAVVSLMQKFVNEEGTEKALLIKSAIALDHLKGYLYVESEKEAYVRRACYGLRNIYSGSIKLVPIKEMTDVLSVEKKSVEIDRGTWVRVKIGLYKGDLGQVAEVDHVKQSVTVKLIPRVDLQAVKVNMDDADGLGRKGRPRPPARFVNMNEVESLRIPVEHKRDTVTGGMFDFFDGKKFMNGYHYKVMSLKSIDGKSITPTFDELQKFQKPPGEDGETTDDLLSSVPASIASKQRGQFMKGDVVQVVEGDLRGIIGVVEKVDEDEVTVHPRHESLKESLLFKEKELRKFYKIGDHVKVIAGQQEGTTGMIIKVDEGVVDIISDVTKEDVKIFARDIVPSSEVTSGLTRLGDYELHDLVQLEGTSVGMIIKIEKDGCHILRGMPDRPEVATYKLRDIRHKIVTKRFTAQDQQGNTVGVNDVVRVLKGKYEKVQGTIEHVNQGLLFLNDKHRQENQGYLCVRASDCRILGGNRIEQSRQPQHYGNNAFTPKSPAHFLQSPRRGGPPFGGGRGAFGRGGRGGQGGRGDRGLIGKVIKIRKGPWKGYQGRIVDVVESMVRLELESQMKVISVPRAELPDAMGEPPTSQRESVRYTPRTGTPITSRTPMHAYMSTPMRDGAMTPLHEGMRTPMRDRAWNPAMTPMRDSNWDDANPSTWSGGAHYEPGYTPYSPATEPNPGTPGVRAYDATTPAHSGWTPTPTFGGARTTVPEAAPAPTPAFSGNAPSPYGLPNTPGGQPMTPGGTQAAYPGTPGGQPMTPGVPMDATSPATGVGGMNDFWGLPDVVVKVRKPNEAESLGVIKEVLLDGICKVALGAEGEGNVVTASHGELELVVPVKGNKIKIMTGENRGEVGKLVGVDGSDGIVKTASLDIKILDMSSLGKALVA
eukprot:TRINITY_DN746_c0_g2_i1.p1 TRINITY_DN746_c0_g2~~TRINITY_DN746_c0_g2_i1.p1  ORF type:complete len:1066 (+),score=270.70 TRINITY_DN746_c0_g2_i1:65-3262(+)